MKQVTTKIAMTAMAMSSAQKITKTSTTELSSYSGVSITKVSSTASRLKPLGDSMSWKHFLMKEMRMSK